MAVSGSGDTRKLINSFEASVLHTQESTHEIGEVRLASCAYEVTWHNSPSHRFALGGLRAWSGKSPACSVPTL